METINCVFMLLGSMKVEVKAGLKLKIPALCGVNISFTKLQTAAIEGCIILLIYSWGTEPNPFMITPR